MNDVDDREKIILALETILEDKTFREAPKSSAFLEYVVLQTLDGHADRIKAYSIAVDALRKPPTFDPQNDPTIRVMAYRVRNMLTNFYNRTEGHEILVECVPGSYVPRFVRPSTAAVKAL